MYGTQTLSVGVFMIVLFENDVKMYGTQTGLLQDGEGLVFENDVKMYGTQTGRNSFKDS